MHIGPIGGSFNFRLDDLFIMGQGGLQFGVKSLLLLGGLSLLEGFLGVLKFRVIEHETEHGHVGREQSQKYPGRQSGYAFRAVALKGGFESAVGNFVT